MAKKKSTALNAVTSAALARRGVSVKPLDWARRGAEWVGTSADEVEWVAYSKRERERYDAENAERVLANLQTNVVAIPADVQDAARRVVQAADALVRHHREPCTQHLYNAHAQCQWCHRMRSEIDAELLARYVQQLSE